MLSNMLSAFLGVSLSLKVPVITFFSFKSELKDWHISQTSLVKDLKNELGLKVEPLWIAADGMVFTSGAIP